MDDASKVSAPPSPSRKRPLDDGASPRSSSSLSTAISFKASPSSAVDGAPRDASPSPSATSSVSGDQPVFQAAGAVPGAPPQKRRKLTAAEKQRQQLDKEARSKERAESKAKREEEKRLEEEDKQRKRAEREEKKKQKEFDDQQKQQEKDHKRQEREQKQQEKEAVKRREEEARQKKERSQLKLNAFFSKPKATAAPAESSEKPDLLSAMKPPFSMERERSASPSKQSPSNAWDRYFLPFSLPQNSVMAPRNAFAADDEYSDARVAQLELDIASGVGSLRNSSDLGAFFRQDSAPPAVRHTLLPMPEIIARVHGSYNAPIDLTEEGAVVADRDPFALLKSVPLKLIHFEEDVRPAYFGTFTKIPSLEAGRRLARNPIKHRLPELDYDYDSEAEWEEPEEGEDLASEGDEDEDGVEGDEDMQGFLDDEDDVFRAKRNLISTDLEPRSSGLCWEDDERRILPVEGATDASFFHGFKMTCLLDSAPVTIDPYSTAYWRTDSVQRDPQGIENESTDKPGLMFPPLRVPLQARPNGGNSKLADGFTGSTSTSQMSNSAGSKPAKRMIPADRMEEFKKAIEGSDLTKLGLIEHLKKMFPTLPKDAINNTLSAVAARVGAREAEKRWILLNTSV